MVVRTGGLNGLVEVGEQGLDMDIAAAARNEALLSDIENYLNRRDDGGNHNLGNDTVITVSDREGTCIIRGKSTFLAKEEKEAVVETHRGQRPNPHQQNGRVEDRGKLIGDSAVSLERDTVGTSATVVSTQDNIKNNVHRGDAGNERRGNRDLR